MGTCCLAKSPLVSISQIFLIFCISQFPQNLEGLINATILEEDNLKIYLQGAHWSYKDLLWEICAQHKEDFQDTDTNKKFNVSIFLFDTLHISTFINFWFCWWQIEHYAHAFQSSIHYARPMHNYIDNFKINIVLMKNNVSHPWNFHKKHS